MEYEIIGNVMPAVELTLKNDEGIYTQSGGMAWMTEGIDMQTSNKGGIMKGLGRIFAGESFFMITYKATADDVQIAFSSTVPGDILPIDLRTYKGLTCQKGTFLCAEETVSLNTVFTKRFTSGMFGGEGFILQEMQGEGMVFLEVDGNSVEKMLAPGEVLKVDTGNVVGFESTVSYDIEAIKGMMNVFLGGEGLFLTRLTGPGKVILQTQNFSEFCGRINSHMPQS